MQTRYGPRKPQAILETALYATDLDAAAGFYGSVLGLREHSRAPGRHIFYRCGDAMLLIFNPRETHKGGAAPMPVPPHGAQGPGHVCFRADPGAIDDWVMRLREHQIAIEADFTWPNGARSIYVRDPAGNSVEFAEPHLWND